MAIKRIVPIDYLNRDFESIKSGLVDHAKRYFPDTFKDFNEASFGALMLDAVAYIGDSLSFYLDYQVNESFIDSAIEYSNVARIARQMGYKDTGRPASSGVVALYVKVPKNTNSDGPNTKLIPILKAGSTFSTDGGVNFTLTQDVDFSDPNNEVVVATVSNNKVQSYAIKAYGTVISGDTVTETITVGAYQPNLLLSLESPDITEVISLIDDEGHVYYEVDNLSQDTIFRRIRNRRDTSTYAPAYVLKPISVPRRYTVERFQTITYVQFGAGSDSALKNVPVPKVSDVALKVTGKNYVTTSNFDPSRLNENDKLGISPSNTTLYITYRTNRASQTNASARALNSVGAGIFDFFNSDEDISAQDEQVVRSTLTVLNEEPIIGDTSSLSVEELKARAFGAISAQSRAVTKLDYESIAYRLPPGFGSIHKCNITQDPDSNRRNMNMYIISKTEPINGNLINTNNVIKSNLKTWLERHKMISDTLDIKDARIINFAIKYKITSSNSSNSNAVLTAVQQNIIDFLGTNDFTIGEPFPWTVLYQVINRTPGVLDTVKVELEPRYSSNYSGTTINFARHMSNDGRTLFVPEDAILELKYPNTDIIGTIA
tara:strand:- start:3481 stop:5286 length:1806 start_codon:yes stop_codon:yes gene_type:complete